MSTKVQQKTLSRRRILQGAGALVISFNLMDELRGIALAADEIPPNPNFNFEEQLTLSPELDSWIRIAADGNVTFLTGRVEIGNGILTALSQIVAEELDVPFERVSLISGDTNIVPNQGITSATTTIGSSANATRIAAATARQVLLELASKELGVAADKLVIADGVISVADDASKTIGYGDLIGGKEFGAKIDVAAPLKAPADYTIVGQSVPRVDIPVKLTASPGDFQENARVTGMRFARTLRAQAYGAKLKSYDESVAKSPGIVAVIPFHYPGDAGLDRVERLETMPGDWIAVVAEREDQAIAAVASLEKTAEWELGAELPTTSDGLYEWLQANGKDMEVQEDHATIAAEYEEKKKAAADVLSATYRIPYQSYAPISPAWALADVKEDSAQIWSATQWPLGSRWMAAQGLGFEHDNQIQLFGGSSSGLYGRRDDYDQEVDVEAALISQKVGQPVRLQWSRGNEFVWSQYRPAQIVSLEAGLSKDGQIDGMQAEVWTAIRGVHPLGPTSALGDAPYELGPRSLTGYDAGPLLRTGWMRNVFRGNNIFALESLMDELAAKAGVDPVEFRLKHTKDQRAIDVINAAATKAGWEPHVGSSGRGMGICFALYAATARPSASYMAYVAEVEVDKSSGDITLKKFTCAIDCGLVINPNGVVNQVEGGVIQAASWAMREAITFDTKLVTNHDWITYPILTFPEMPQIEVEILDRKDEPSKGIGEPVTVPVAAAIANAVFDATGARVRDLPMSADHVKAALAAV